MWESTGIGYLLIGGALSGIAGLWAFFRSGGRKKLKVEQAAQEQATKAQAQSQLSELFEDTTALKKYVDEAVATAVAPLERKLETASRLHSAFRTFFTQVFFWDRGGRVGPLPLVPANVLEELRLEHFLGLPLEDTEPLIRKD